MFAAATSFFARSAISQSYNIGGSASSGPGSRSSTPGPQSPGPSTSTFGSSFTPSIVIGLWKVQSATHKVTNKRVSVWTFDKRGPDLERLGPAAKERTLEILKAEASALSRLRHPSILEMVEPLEETRNELIFATEPVIASLDLSIPGAGKLASLVELDEVEIQKGILQVCKGLSFLHSSAQLIHSNLCPESIIINQSGDWKVAGLGLTIPLLQPNGSPTRWEFPTFDGRVPSYIQRSFDYMAPEYALDEVLNTASDLYSLGCIIYAVHCKGSPPFKTHGSLSGLRDDAGRAVPGLERLDRDLQSLLRSMITRHPSGRPTPSTLSSHSFFSSLPISTLNFLDRSTFTAKTREEKISFMKGLTTVLDKFSDGLKTRKILPSLLEEMKDTHLLPYILPNVFKIASVLSSSQFAAMVLPSLKPLFAVKEPPNNMLTLLDNLPMLQSKTDKNTFKTEVLPLVYTALESEHSVVQEKALKMVPDLCETVDYAEVQGVMFPRVAVVCRKTRVLSVKVTTLETLLSMVKTLDTASLTQKMVPLLGQIRTKEPSVTMATLSVHEAMGFKVDREAVATLVLPQLWSMSIGPMLSLNQFQRFMSIVRKLGDRVEKEHAQYLRDSQRLEDRSTLNTDGGVNMASFSGNVDFESLVGKSSGGESAQQNGASSTGGETSWEDDVWGSILGESPSIPSSSVQSVTSSPVPTPVQTQSRPPLSSPPSKFSPRAHQTSFPAVSPNISRTPSSLSSSFSAVPQTKPIQPTLGSSMSPMPSMSSGPPSMGMMFSQNTTPLMPMTSSPPPPSMVPMGGLLAPSQPTAWKPTPNKSSKDDWGDFDPLS
ncbi:Protein kinase domain-containing protein ppk32 [Marasmius tenuissimus]|nr:Protein kinase domain-containing protein ppk32 [Marasmius tenuissimus]